MMKHEVSPIYVGKDGKGIKTRNTRATSLTNPLAQLTPALLTYAKMTSEDHRALRQALDDALARGSVVLTTGAQPAEQQQGGTSSTFSSRAAHTPRTPGRRRNDLAAPMLDLSTATLFFPSENQIAAALQMLPRQASGGPPPATPCLHCLGAQALSSASTAEHPALLEDLGPPCGTGGQNQQLAYRPTRLNPGESSGIPLG